MFIVVSGSKKERFSRNNMIQLMELYGSFTVKTCNTLNKKH